MKKIKFLLSFVFVFVLVGVIINNADAKNNRTDCTSTPITSTWGSSPVTFCEDTGILNVEAGTLKATSTLYIDSDDNDVPGQIKKDEIKKIILSDGVIAPEDSSFLFGSEYENMYFFQLEEINGILNTENVVNMYGMFEYTSSLVNLDVSNWDVSNVEDMSLMFSRTSLETIDVSNWDTSNVNSMWNMFFDASSLRIIDVSKWDTSKVIKLSQAFRGTNSLENLDVSNWNTSNVKEMSGVFMMSYLIDTLDLSNWDTRKVDDMQNLFFNADQLKYLKLGENSIFSDDTALHDINTRSTYTGQWIKVDSDQGYQPSQDGVVFNNSNDFMKNYDGSTKQQGWYTWEKNPIVISEIEKPILKESSKPGEKPTLEIPETIVGYTFSTPEYIMENDYKGVIKVKANILPGYVWQGDENDLLFEYSFTLAIKVTPIAPKLKDVVECGNEPDLVITEQEGVKFEYEKLDGKYFVKAIPEDGYYFSEDAQDKWEFDIVVVDCPIIVEPEVTNPTSPKIPDTGSNDLFIALVSVISIISLFSFYNHKKSE